MRPTSPLRLPSFSAPENRSTAATHGRLRFAICMALACSSGAALATPQPAGDGGDATDLGAVMVVAQRADRVSSGATNLDLGIKDTPQSISVVSDEQMAQFGTTSVNDAPRLATGVQVEEWETNRTTYT